MSVELFRDDDRGYVAWLNANASCYVLHPANADPAGCPCALRMVLDYHWDVAARQDMDWTIRKGMFFVAAGAGRLGARARQVRRHPVWHLPAAGCIIRHVMKRAAGPAARWVRAGTAGA